MMENITLCTCVEDWRKDIDLGMGLLGIYRIDHYKKGLYSQLRKLENLLKEYEGVAATLICNDYNTAPYWYKLEVCVNHSFLKFNALVCYEVTEEKKLIAKIHYTDQPSTVQFLLEGGVEWKTIILSEPNIMDPAYVVANIKNLFICSESYRQIGRAIL
jgi:hypothetical protein